MMSDDLRGATALVTGASGGLGKHIGRELASHGVNLVLSGRDEAALEERAATLRECGVRVEVVPADLSDSSAIAEVISGTESALAPIDLLVNNAGIEISARFTAMSPSEIEGQVAVNLTAAMLLTRAALPGMLARGRGHVVNVSSRAGKMMPPFQTGYVATKAGLVGFTHGLRRELRDEPVRVSVICPGFVRGDGMYARMQEAGLRAPALTGASPPEDVSRAVVRAIVKDSPEIAVTPRPFGPLPPSRRRCRAQSSGLVRLQASPTSSTRSPACAVAPERVHGLGCA